VRYLESFMYYFNPREGTKAYTMDHQLPSEVRMKRLQNLIALQRSISVEIKQQRVGRVETALIEGVSKRNEKQLLGRTEHNEMVVFEPNAPLEVGDVVSVQLKELVGNTYVAHQL
ncbi:MAG: TRAM domain-containing protein, partial [Sphaerochaetaceae bacterium]